MQLQCGIEVDDQRLNQIMAIVANKERSIAEQEDFIQDLQPVLMKAAAQYNPEGSKASFYTYFQRACTFYGISYNRKVHASSRIPQGMTCELDERQAMAEEDGFTFAMMRADLSPEAQRIAYFALGDRAEGSPDMKGNIQYWVDKTGMQPDDVYAALDELAEYLRRRT